MSNPIVDVDVIIVYKPRVIRIQIDTREASGTWDAARVKVAATEIAYDRERHGDEQPEILEVKAVIQ